MPLYFNEPGELRLAKCIVHDLLLATGARGFGRRSARGKRSVSNYSKESYAITSSMLCTVEHANDDQFVVPVVDFVHDDVGESYHRPLKGAGVAADMADVRKFRKTIGVRENAFDDVSCGSGTAILDIEMDGRNVCALQS
jgi:hypothetical protein